MVAFAMVLFRLIGLFFDLLLLPLRLYRRSRIIEPGAWLSITIDGAVVDVIAPSRSILRFWQARAQKATSLHRLTELVDRMTADPRVKGLLVTIRSLGGGMASAASLRTQLVRAKAAGKEVAVHLPLGGDTKEIYVASAANKVLLAPTAQLAPFGFRSGALYFKNALEKAGIEPQVFACGEFKSAGETLVRDSMSPQQRAQVERLLETFHQSVVTAIGERGIDGAKAIDEAPYFGRAAVAAGLVDDLAYEDEVPAKLGVASVDDFVDGFAYLGSVTKPLVRRLRRGPSIAVVPVHGAITQAAGAFGDLSTDERVGRMIRAARKNRRVKGVILHVDSPGGSALASDRMHHEIAQLAREKPVVCCMANVAASGGYYVAAPCKVIVAEPTTVTGSIGVVAARVSLDPLLERLGIVREVVEKGARSALLSPTGALDDDAKAVIARELDATYKAFIGVVADGRKLEPDAVEKLARGRVYTGADAHAAKLIDVLGGFDVAVAELRKLLPEKVRAAEVQLATTPRQAAPLIDPPKLPAELRLVWELRETRVLALGPIAET
jgi:protease-4